MPNSEQRVCQNCKASFEIDASDFDFYEKIKVPAPTFCPECRLVRRMHVRNERALYRGECKLCGKKTLSIYSPDKVFITYCHECWWSDKWNVMDYGMDYDFNKQFFQQWRELLKKTPRLILSVKDVVDSDYCNASENEKGCYLNSAGDYNERVMFSNRIVRNKDSLDLYICSNSELCYDLVNCLQCYKLFSSRNCIQCRDSAFLSDCHNCSHCFACCNLRNREYCIFNQQYSKADYQEKLKEFNLGSFSDFIQTKQKYNDFVLKNPRRFATIIKSVKTSGDNIRNAKNCQDCFDVIGDPSAEDCKFAVWAGEFLRDSYDAGVGCGLKLERAYEATDTGVQSGQILFASVVYSTMDAQYVMNCYSCSHLFGCCGLRNKQYCILNKQYSKEEYETLVPKIISHMNDMPYISRRQKSKVKSQNYNSKDKNEETTETEEIVYRYGEFFPPELSPFCYNETIAQEYFPLTKQQAIEQGYNWRDPEPRNYQINIKSQDLPDNIKDVKDDILNQVIECQHQGKCNEQCTEAFKIIEPELAFYRRMNLPLPRLCPNCRHYQRLKQRNPLKLWTRQCQCQARGQTPPSYTNTAKHEHGDKPCPNTFQTSYGPERPEIVYCESCYLKEVV